jgi:hypothetical protein
MKTNDVSREHVDSIFRVEEKAKQKSSMMYVLVSCLVYYSALKMKAASFSETSVDFQRTMLRYVPENMNIDNPHRGNLKS